MGVSVICSGSQRKSNGAIMEIDKEGIENSMIERCADLEGKRILEVGCGDGRVTSFLAAKAGKLVAIDPDEGCIAKARETIGGVDFSVGSGEALEFEGPFDIIMFTMSLHHHGDVIMALKEAYRLLARDGRLLILEPAVDGEIQRLFHLFTNEIEAIEKTREAIDGSDFYLERRETFYKDWVFEDKEELYGYHFEHYGNSLYDGSIIGSMNELLGDKINGRPITVKDRLEIFSMGKEN
jgi:ubiquinone/menaquinone biosynthesis C-methylase UbiE